MNGKADGAHARSVSAYAQPQRQQQRRQGRFIAIGIAAVIFILIVASMPALPDAATRHLPKRPNLPKLSDLNNPFAQAVHKPPVQSNSSSGDTKWYADWKWLNPFSSTITLDDTRTVLPPSPLRPPIYTYYDPLAQTDPAIKKEDYRLLQIWRRAWWAQGFKPIILGRAEAMKNPLFEVLQRKELFKSLESELMRWLAWGHMGDGILSNWLVLPMAPRNDHDLSYLRRGHYPGLTRYESLGTGIFAGPASGIEAAIKAALDNPKVQDRKTIFEAIEDPHVFDVEPNPPGIAFYESGMIAKLYRMIAEKIADDKAEGLSLLGELINSHLHGTFLAANCPDGFNILTPKPEAMLLSAPANELVAALNECPSSPLPRSCPPNNSKCKPCTPVQTKYRPSINNATKEFTVGTIPHPYTHALLIQSKPPDEVNVRVVRRFTDRDPWLEKSTEQVLTAGVSAYVRIVHFKEWIVTDAGQTRGIWHSAERQWQWRELEWRFGFALSGRNGTIVIPQPSDTKYPAVIDAMVKASSKRPTRKDIVRQYDLFQRAKEQLAKTRWHKGTDMRRVVEAWNLADTEAWRFVRAFEARARVERDAWLDEERRYIGGDLEGDHD